MKGIHCFSTRPMLQGRDISGHPKDVFKMIEFPDYMLGTLLLSALQWRKTNGPIKLYTDSVFYNYLSDKGVLDFWDDVSCDLDYIDEAFPDIDHAIFWSAAKFYAYQKETAPFTCVDTDIVVWHPIVPDAESALLFTHWESIETGDTSYIGKEDLCVSSEYSFLSNYEKVTRGLNMSLTVFTDEEFKKAFCEEAIRFMINSSKKYDGRYATPEILYMEQILPVQLAIENQKKITPLIECMWSPKQFRFVENTSKPWNFNSFDQTQLCMHLWFHKNYIDKNLGPRQEYMNSLKEAMRKNFPNEYERFIKAIN